MLQLNLLPDVKQEYIKAENQRRLVISVSVIVTAASIGLLVLLLSMGALQKKHISDLNDDIDTYSKELKGKREISKILTVQNQLDSLTALHASKPAVARAFDYLNQVTPAQIDITSMTIDFNAKTISITGTTKALSDVNKYVDTLKFTKYKSDAKNAPDYAFSNVVMSSFAIGTAGSAANKDKPATYTITLVYNPDIFDITQEVNLTVPKTTTTRSNSDSPTDLFNGNPAPAAGAN